MKRHPWLVLVFAATVAAAACGGGEDAATDGADTTAMAEAPAPPTLYDRLGGETALRAVVDDLVARAAADDTLNFTRQGTAAAWEATPANVETLKQRLVQFIGHATGGPQIYGGRDMATAHAGMEITDAEFDRLGGHLGSALTAYDVPEEEKQELFTIVESTRSAIVSEQ